MPAADEYRIKAAEIMAKARQEADLRLYNELEKLALAYLRLADQADLNALTDLVYETPSPAQQPQQQQHGTKDE
jgi:hypothetical protein